MAARFPSRERGHVLCCSYTCWVPQSSYAKPYFTVPEQIALLRERGMACGDDAFASNILERCNYYRLSGYWFPYREYPQPPLRWKDEDGREIRLSTFRQSTTLVKVWDTYRFDQDLRERLGSLLSEIEIAFRFLISHRIGKLDPFIHREPEKLGQFNGEEPTTSYHEWLTEYDKQENRAEGEFIEHFRDNYGPHLPIWVATEVMSFGQLSLLYNLCPQEDRRILAERLQIMSAPQNGGVSGRGDVSALSNWLNALRKARNLCFHYARVWNRSFDVTLQAPGEAQHDQSHPLHCLNKTNVNNKLYGLLVVCQYLLKSINPSSNSAFETAKFVSLHCEDESDCRSVGFPLDWKQHEIWSNDFSLSRNPVIIASALDWAPARSASKLKAYLEPDKHWYGVPVGERVKGPVNRQKMLRSYRSNAAVIELRLGSDKYYPTFQFRDGVLINQVGDINQELVERLTGMVRETDLLGCHQLKWWITSNDRLTPLPGESNSPSPLHLLNQYLPPESTTDEILNEGGVFLAMIENSKALDLLPELITQ